VCVNYYLLSILHVLFKIAFFCVCVQLAAGVYSEPHFTDEGSHVLDGLQKQGSQASTAASSSSSSSSTSSSKSQSSSSTSSSASKSSSSSKTVEKSTKSPYQTNFPSEASVMSTPPQAQQLPSQPVAAIVPNQQDMDMEMKKGMLAQGAQGDMKSPPPPLAALMEQSSSSSISAGANGVSSGVSNVVLVPIMGLVGLVMVGVGLVFKHFRDSGIRQRKMEQEERDMLMA
jgi:cobalamin biosynthesis Mg chelatase CobN